MRQSTVCFLMRDAPACEVLLGYKKAGFGSGKYAGIGGKVEPGETVEAAAVREVEEEIGVRVPAGALQFMGKVTFVFPFQPGWTQEVSIFLARQWQGEPGESDEMEPHWFAPARAPYDAMWQDARLWIPPVLEGKAICATISFREDNETVDEADIRPWSDESGR